VIRASLLLAIITLGACTLQPQPLPSGSWQAYQSRVSQLNDWTLAGKLGFRAPDNGGSATLNWMQRQNNYRLRLSGPFGAGSAQIDGNSQLAEMRYDDKIYRQTPEQLAEQLTGVPLPVSALSWWARGVPSPSQPLATALATSPDGYASGFDQAGWQLSFSHFKQTDAGHLPGKITGTHTSSEGRSYSFKLLISSWSFLEEE